MGSVSVADSSGQVSERQSDAFRADLEIKSSGVTS
jgi:hypothetical protein